MDKLDILTWGLVAVGLAVAGGAGWAGYKALPWVNADTDDRGTPESDLMGDTRTSIDEHTAVVSEYTTTLQSWEDRITAEGYLASQPLFAAAINDYQRELQEYEQARIGYDPYSSEASEQYRAIVKESRESVLAYQEMERLRIAQL